MAINAVIHRTIRQKNETWQSKQTRVDKSERQRIEDTRPGLSDHSYHVPLLN